jgi:hypothetical protein
MTYLHLSTSWNGYFGYLLVSHAQSPNSARKGCKGYVCILCRKELRDPSCERRDLDHSPNVVGELYRPLALSSQQEQKSGEQLYVVQNANGP